MPQSAGWQVLPTIPIWKLSDAGRDDRPVCPHDFDGKSMDAALEFGIQRLHDGTMLLEASAAGELRGRDSDAEMGFPFGSRTSVAFMSVALIDHFKMGRCEFLGKFLNNRVANGHMDTGSGVFWTLKRN